jgi:membrane protease YdiL (CAAX protease family)
LKEIAENLLVFLLATFAVALVQQSGLSGRSIIVPAVWALGAWLPTGKGELRPTRSRSLKQLLFNALRYYFLSTLILFPLFGGGFFLYCWLGLPYPKFDMPLGVSLIEWICYQYFLVGIFEELFFREYLYSQAKNIAPVLFSGKIWIFWAPILYSAFLFGIAHVVVDMNPARFFAFIPGLLFAWLRARTGSLTASVLSHGSSNVFYMLLLKSVS